MSAVVVHQQITDSKQAPRNSHVQVNDPLNSLLHLLTNDQWKQQYRTWFTETPTPRPVWIQHFDLKQFAARRTPQTAMPSSITLTFCQFQRLTKSWLFCHQAVKIHASWARWDAQCPTHGEYLAANAGRSRWCHWHASKCDLCLYQSFVMDFKKV